MSKKLPRFVFVFFLAAVACNPQFLAAESGLKTKSSQTSTIIEKKNHIEKKVEEKSFFFPQSIKDFYSPELYQSLRGNPQELASALEKEILLKEQSDAGELPGNKEIILANLHLFLAHTYLEKLKQPKKAAPHFKAFVNNLEKGKLVLNFLTRDYIRSTFTLEKDRESVDAAVQALEEYSRWLELRTAWTNYIELGFQCGDIESLNKGEESLRKIADGDIVRERNWLSQETGIQKIGGVNFKLQALHPNQNDSSVDFSLPFLPDTQHFVLTVDNQSKELVKFTADDFSLEGQDTPLTALPEERIPWEIVFSAPLEQFIYPELSPCTFSDMPQDTYNNELIEVNNKKSDLILDAKIEEGRAGGRIKTKKVLRTILSIYSVLGQAQMAANAGVAEANASNYSDKASNARSAGYSGAARSYQASANFYSAYAQQQKSALASIQQSNDKLFNYSDLTIENDEKVKKAWAKVQAIQPPEIFSFPPYVMADREYSEVVNRTLEKLKKFTEADRFLPARSAVVKKEKYAVTFGEMMKAFDKPKTYNVKEELGSAIRVKPGKKWTGILCFSTKALNLKSGALAGTVQCGDAKHTLNFSLNAKPVFVIYPKTLGYYLQLVGQSDSWGETKLPVALPWGALFPRFVR